MLKSTLTRLREDRAIEDESAESGFTLIELMVVLLIIAILLAIAIPTFLGVTGSANDRASQSNLTNGLTELKALYQNGQTYCEANCASGVTALALTGVNSVQSSAPEFSWQTSGTNLTAGNQIGAEPVDVTGAGVGDGIVIASQSKTTTCWFAVDLESTPQAAFGGGDVGNQQFIVNAAGTVGGQWQTQPSSQAVAAGVYYSKVVNDGGTCKANEPFAAGGSTSWVWGSSYANAPADVVGTN